MRTRDLFDKRWWIFLWQRITRGFSDGDTFALDLTIAQFVHLRLKRFNEITHDHSSGPEYQEWNEIKAKMLWSMEQIAQSKGGDFIHPSELNDEEVKEYYRKLQEGLELFGKNFRSLWW